GWAERLNMRQGDGLEVDASGPLFAERLEHGPGDRGLRAEGIQVGPDRLRAVRPAAAEPEVHAAADVLGRPARCAIGRHGANGAVEGAVLVRRALPRGALGGARLDVAQTWPDAHARADDPR